MGRYISSGESWWRIMCYPFHVREPGVEQLEVHLENSERVYFHPDHVLRRFQRPPLTTLKAWFLLNQEDEFARTLKYVEVPSYFRRADNSSPYQRRK